jgi:hypothetical protein
MFDDSFISGFKILRKLKSGSEKAVRSIELHAEFSNFKPEPRSYFHIRKKNPNYKPSKSKITKNFVQDLSSSLDNIFKSERNIFQRVPSNLRQTDLIHLCEFLLRSDVRVVLADKNMGFAIVNASDLKGAIDRKLLNGAFVKVTKEDGLRQLSQSVEEFSKLLYSDHLLAKNCPKEFMDIYKAVLPDAAKISPNSINPLAKVHKDTFNLTTWRLIVQAHRSFAQVFDAWFARFMDPVLSDIPTFVRDSPSTIYLIEQLKLDPNKPYTFGKVDVTDLYNNLNLDLVGKALEFYLESHFKFLSERNISTGPWSIKTILKLLNIANRSNFVEYEGFWYRQLVGIAMGRAAGVTIATLTLAFVETRLKTDLFVDNSLIFHRRYIDDIIFIREGDLLRTGNDVARAYKQALGIETTLEACRVSMNGSDYKSIDILDFTITRDSAKFVISPYDKPTNLHLFIPPRSNHPGHVGCGWIRAFLQRLARNSSNFEIFSKAALAFFDQLRARGFRSSTLLIYFGDFPYSKVRQDFWSKFLTTQRSYGQRVMNITDSPNSFFYVPIPFNKGTGAIKWTKLLNGIRDSHADDLEWVTKKYPKFRTAWTTLPSLATLVVRTLQARFQGSPNPNPND